MSFVKRFAMVGAVAFIMILVVWEPSLYAQSEEFKEQTISKELSGTIEYIGQSNVNISTKVARDGSETQEMMISLDSKKVIVQRAIGGFKGLGRGDEVRVVYDEKFHEDKEGHVFVHSKVATHIILEKKARKEQSVSGDVLRSDDE